MKKQHCIKLTGMTANDTVASIQEADMVAYFQNVEKGVAAYPSEESPDGWVLTTKKGDYEMMKHPVMNYWAATCKGVKTQFTKKKLVAQAIYLA